MTSEQLKGVEFVNADLEDKESLIKATDGVKFVINTAAPAPSEDFSSEEDFINKCIRCVNNLLDASKQNQVKRVVMTSCIQAADGHLTYNS